MERQALRVGLLLLLLAVAPFALAWLQVADAEGPRSVARAVGLPAPPLRDPFAPVEGLPR